MFCIQCGKQIPNHAKFCSGCGAKVPPEVSQNRPAQSDSTYRYVPPKGSAREEVHTCSAGYKSQGTPGPESKPKAVPKPEPKPAATANGSTSPAPKKGGCLPRLLILVAVILAVVCGRLNLSIPELVEVIQRGEPLKDRAMYDLQMRLEERDTSLTIQARNWDENLCPWSDVGWYVQDYLRATPELFYVDIRNTTIGVGEMDGKPVCRIKFAYLEDLTSEASRKKMEAAADKILDAIPYASNDWEKALYIHDALIRNVTYEAGERDQTAYGALVDGKAVCMGYALAYEYLLTRAGIEADTVCGYSSEFAAAFDDTLLEMPGHAWTVITFTENGLRKSCFVDTTWDDMDKKDIYGNDYISYRWFGVTLDELQQEGRSTLEMGYDLSQWDLDNMDLNYYVRNDAMISSYNLDRVVSIMQNQIFQGNRLLSVRMADMNTLRDTMYYMEDEGDMHKLADALGIDEYAYSFNYKPTGEGLISFDIYLNYPEG